MDSLIKSLKNDDVCNFEKLIHLLDKLDLSDLPDIFCNNPNFIAYAAFYGATKCLLFLLKQGMKIENVDDESRSAIHFACAGGNLKMVQMIIEDFNQLNYVDSLCRTALHYSVQYDQTEISKFLVENYEQKHTQIFEASNMQTSLSINKKDIFGVTPFHLSVENDNIELVEYFIKNGANLNLADNDGCTPIHYASKIGSIRLISTLVNNGAKIHKKSKNGRTVFHFAAFSHFPIFRDLFELFESHRDMNISINTPDKFGRIPLHYACEEGSYAVVHELLKLHSNVAHRDIDMMMPIHFAAINGNANIIQLLINYGSPVYVKDENLRTPLHLACESGSLRAVRFLCNKYKNLINEETKYGSTPLHSVAENYDNAQLVQFLISKGSDIDKKNKFGQTPLHCATQNGLYNNIGVLIDSGANLNISDNSSCNPLDIAFNQNDAEAKEMLIENGACFSPKRSAATSRLSSSAHSPCSSPKILRTPLKVEQKDFKLDILL